MPDPQERLQRAREQLALLISYGNDGGLRGEQASAELAAAEAELAEQAPAAVEPEAPAATDRLSKRPRGK